MRSVTQRTVRRWLMRTELWNGNREPPLHTILRNRDHVIRWAWRTHPELSSRVRACVAARPRLLAVRLGSRHEAAAWLHGPLSASATSANSQPTG